MKQKKVAKKQPDWYVGTTHFLTAGFVIPFLSSLIVGFILITFGITPESLMSIAARSLTFLIGMYFGIQYSANYIRKTHTSYNKRTAVKVGVYIFVLFGITMSTLLLYLLINGRIDLYKVVLQISTMIITPIIYHRLSYSFLPTLIENEPTQAAKPYIRTKKRSFIGNDVLTGIILLALATAGVFYFINNPNKTSPTSNFPTQNNQEVNGFMPINERPLSNINNSREAQPQKERSVSTSPVITERVAGSVKLPVTTDQLPKVTTDGTVPSSSLPEPSITFESDGTYYSLGNNKYKMTAALNVPFDDVTESGEYLHAKPAFSPNKDFVYFSTWYHPSSGDTAYFVYDVKRNTTNKVEIQNPGVIEELQLTYPYLDNIRWVRDGIVADFFIGESQHYDGRTNCFKGFRATSALSDQPHKIVIDLTSTLDPSQNLETHIICSSI